MVLAATGLSVEAKSPKADLVVVNAQIYTQDAALQRAQALAVKDGRFLYVGTAKGARRFIGRGTRTADAAGKTVLPGLIDAHIHPVAGLYPLDVCDLESEAMSLREIAAIVKQCIARQKPKPGQWISVMQWNFAVGNQTDVDHPTIRAALDLAAPNNPVQVIGNDFHHGAFNSAALATAKNDHGKVVGYNRASLAGEFAHFAKLIGVDSKGEPDGTVNEEARLRMQSPSLSDITFDAVMSDPTRTVRVLNSKGITAIQDAAVRTGATNRFYDELYRRNQLFLHVTLAQLYVPERYKRKDESIDYDAIVSEATAFRARYADNPLIKADVVKIFADGVIEGNPRAVPPTLPNAASLKHFEQPILGTSAGEHVTVKGYVDLDGPLCQEVRVHGENYHDARKTASFQQRHGFHPAQCLISNGKPQHERSIFLEYARRMHLAGFALHLHAVGDGGVRLALDGIEQARAADGVTSLPDAIAHLQLVAPEDVQRLGRNRIHTVYTFSWAQTDPDYDVTVIPFIQRVKDESYAGLHDPHSYYEQQAYPTRSTIDAGAILAAGSDAPVDDRDPRPFVNMSIGILRSLPGKPALNLKQRLDVREVLAAYTINGAKAVGRAAEIGSIEVGKSADFIMIDRDIVALGDKGEAEKIADTKVIKTWFKGAEVYAAE